MRFFVASVLMMVTTVAMSAEHRFLWIDADSSTRVEHAKLSARDLGMDGSWWIEKSVLHGGKQEGVDVITVNNGRAEFVIVPTRGMSIWEVRAGDIRLGWDSPVNEIVHPHFVNLENRGGLGWLEGFGGWFVRCGLQYTGAPGLDKQVTNTGSVVENSLTLHGKIDYIPASRAEVEIDDDGTISVHGVVHENEMFGSKMRLNSVFTVKPDALYFEVSDTVTNDSGHDQEMMVIYHPNFGPPLLGEGSEVYVAANRVSPRDDRAADTEIEDIFVYDEPTAGYVEQVYYIQPKADRTGNAPVLLQNKSGKQGMVMTFKPSQLKGLSLWKNTTALEDGYVSGIEPGTSYPNNRSIERKNGNVPVLKPGESQQFDLSFEILDSAERIGEIKNQIKNIQGNDQTKFDTKPVEGISF
jgi:galactose mutarotase-like enzyme